MVSNRVHSAGSKLTALICIQGGGARGGWQGAILEELLAPSSSLSPVAAFGSSAGAINCVLINSKLQHGKATAFADYWLQVPKHRLRNSVLLILASICNFPLVFARLLRYCASPVSRRRLPGIVPYNAFRWVLTNRLPQHFEAKIHTYMYTTDIDKDAPPLVIDDQNLASFLWKPNTAVAEVILDGANGNIAISDAVAMSSCLPSIVPAKLDGRHVADGGIYSNLPLDVVHSHGSLGADAIFFLLATPVFTLCPATEFIDWRTVVLLRRLKAEQLLAQRRSHRGQAGVCPAHAISPIFLIQPSSPLRSGRLCGFLRNDLMKQDFESGKTLGQHLRSLVSDFCNGNHAAMQSLELVSVKLPHTPIHPPPLRQWWVNFVNLKWKN